jgi:hypothetical protein
MFLHVFNSWFVSQLIHPIVFFPFLYLIDGPFGNLPISVLLLFILISMVISCPSLLFGWLFLGSIMQSDLTITAKFSLWLFASAITVILDLLLLMLICLPYGEIEAQYLVVGIPGILSIWITATIRLRQFRNLIPQLIKN